MTRFIVHIDTARGEVTEHRGSEADMNRKFEGALRSGKSARMWAEGTGKRAHGTEIPKDCSYPAGVTIHR